MTDIRLDPRAAGWLDLGPTRAPATATRRSWPRWLRRRSPVPGCASWAPVIFAPRVLRVAALDRSPGSALRLPRPDPRRPRAAARRPAGAVPGARSILDASGGPAAEDATPYRALPKGYAFVVAATCAGGARCRSRSRTADRVPPGRPRGGAAPRRALDVPATARSSVDRFATGPDDVGPVEMTADVRRGDLAGGLRRVRGISTARVSSADVTDGTVLMMDGPAMFTYGDPGRHRPPAAARRRAVTVLVQCIGNTVTVTNDAGVCPSLACTTRARRRGSTCRRRGSQRCRGHGGSPGSAWLPRPRRGQPRRSLPAPGCRPSSGGHIRGGRRPERGLRHARLERPRGHARRRLAGRSRRG